MTREQPTTDYFLRHVFRWYSKTFSVDLRQVPDLPLHDVLQHFYESSIEEMDDETRLKELQVLSVDGTERAEKEDRERLDSFRFERLDPFQLLAQTKRKGPAPGVVAPVPVAVAPPEPGMPEVVEDLTFDLPTALDEEDGLSAATPLNAPLPPRAARPRHHDPR